MVNLESIYNFLINYKNNEIKTELAKILKKYYKDCPSVNLNGIAIKDWLSTTNK